LFEYKKKCSSVSDKKKCDVICLKESDKKKDGDVGFKVVDDVNEKCGYKKSGVRD
jgi:hypothetical protein